MYTFNIQTDKTTRIALQLFESCAQYVEQQVESLYRRTIEIKGLEDNYCCLLINGNRYYRGQEYIPNHLNNIQYLPVDPSLQEEADKLEAFINQARKDARFIQMWLSLVVNERNVEITKSLMPPALARVTQYKDIDVEYKIPKGKEELWHKAEEKIQFYLGLKLVL